LDRGNPVLTEKNLRFDYKRHIKEVYKSIRRQFEFRARTREEFEAWQSAFRPKLREALGLTSMEEDPQDHTPKAERVSSVDLGDYIREKWCLWVEPTVPLPFWLLKPRECNSRLPLVLTPQWP